MEAGSIYWSSSEQDINRYEYSIGTTPYASDIVPFINVGTATQAWVTGFNLTANQIYYFTVKSFSSSGAESNPGCSDGIIYRPASLASSILDALELPDTTIVLLKSKTVSGLFANRFYLRDTDGIRSIAVSCTNGPAENTLCDVTGTLDTIAGERVLTPGCITPAQP